MAMPSAKGLFHKAIVQSGAIPGFGKMTKDAGEELTAAILKELGVALADLDKLSILPTDRLCQVAMAAGRPFRWSPVVDGNIITSPPGGEAALAPGVPLMVGTVLNELTNAVGDPRAAMFDDTALSAAARKAYGARAEAIVDAYRRANPGRAPIELWNSMQAAGIRAASYDLAAHKHAVDGKAWQYLFTWRTPMLEGRPKTFHSAEIAFAFDNAGLCENQTGGGPEALRLAAQMSDAWIAFARNGDPNHKALPRWPAFDSAKSVMIFDAPCRIADDFEGEGMRMIAAGEGTRP